MSPVAASDVNDDSRIVSSSIRSDSNRSVTYGKGQRSEVFQKMKSTGQIETTRRESSAEARRHMMNYTSHTISTDLISMKNLSKSKIIDSHTSYRQVLDEEITRLKLQLAEAQAKADTVQNELVLTRKDCEIKVTRLDDLKKHYEDARTRAKELATVVTHLQGNAKESALERATLRNNSDELAKEQQKYVQLYNKSINDHKRMKRMLKDVNKDVEGLRMENHGLRCENEILRKDLKRRRAINSDLHVDGENEQPIHGIREFLVIPSKSKGMGPKTTSDLTVSSIQRRDADFQEDLRVIDEDEGEDTYTSFADLQQMNRIYIGGRNRSSRLRKNDSGEADQILSKIATIHGRDSDDDAYDYLKDMKSVLQQAVLKPVSLIKIKQSENDRRIHYSDSEAADDRKDAKPFLQFAASFKKLTHCENDAPNRPTYRNSNNANDLIPSHVQGSNGYEAASKRKDASCAAIDQIHSPQKWNWFPFIQTSQKINKEKAKEIFETSDETFEDRIQTARETDSLYSSEDARVPVVKPNERSMTPSQHGLGKILVPKSLR